MKNLLLGILGAIPMLAFLIALTYFAEWIGVL